VAQKVREWFPDLVDSGLRQPSWGLIETLAEVVPMSVIHQLPKEKRGAGGQRGQFPPLYGGPVPQRGAPR
jgi:hypothetical protein